MHLFVKIDKIWLCDVINYLHKKVVSSKGYSYWYDFYIMGYCSFVCNSQKVGRAFWDGQGQPWRWWQNNRNSNNWGKHCSCAQSHDGWQMFNWESREHSAQWIRNVEGFRNMGAGAFDAWPKTDQADPVTSKPGYLLSRPSQFSWQFSHTGWVLGTPLWTRDQKTICAVAAPWFTPSKEGKGCVLSRVGDGISFLECKGHCVHRLPSERQNYWWGILCQHAEAVTKSKQPG